MVFTSFSMSRGMRVEHRPHLRFGHAVGHAVVARRPPAHAVMQDGPVFGSERLEIERHQHPAALELGDLLRELFVRWFCAGRQPVSSICAGGGVSNSARLKISAWV